MDDKYVMIFLTKMAVVFFLLYNILDLFDALSLRRWLCLSSLLSWFRFSCPALSVLVSKVLDTVRRLPRGDTRGMPMKDGENASLFIHSPWVK